MMIVAAWIVTLALPQDGPPVSFEKKILTDKYYCDGINAGDVNGDGKTDVVAGPFWYEGPDLSKKHEFYPAVVHPTEPSPTNSMFSYLYDFNGDGRMDILKLGRVHKHAAQWFENPGDATGVWARHDVSRRKRGMFDKFLGMDMDADGDTDFVSTRGNSVPYDGVFWLEQVRSPSPRPSFEPAREIDSEEVALPAGSGAP